MKKMIEQYFQAISTKTAKKAMISMIVIMFWLDIMVIGVTCTQTAVLDNLESIILVFLINALTISCIIIFFIRCFCDLTKNSLFSFLSMEFFISCIILSSTKINNIPISWILIIEVLSLITSFFCVIFLMKSYLAYAKKKKESAHSNPLLTGAVSLFIISTFIIIRRFFNINSGKFFNIIFPICLYLLMIIRNWFIFLFFGSISSYYKNRIVKNK